MDGQRKAGNELLAISHNANLSDGRMYPTEVDLHGRPIDRAYAEDRMRNEPLIEINQTKGQSETHPAAVAQRRIRQLQHLGLSARRPAGAHRAYRRQLRPPGAQRRHRPAGYEGLQPVQIRLRRRLGLALHRRALPAGQLLRDPRRCGRKHREAHVGRPRRRHGRADHRHPPA